MTVRFLFDFISPYAYLAYHGLGTVAERHNTEIHAVPVLFAGLLNHHGQKGPAEIPAKRLYVFKDVMRSARRLGIHLEPPPSHPFNPLLALRVCGLDMPPETRWKLVGLLLERVWGGGGGVADSKVVEAVATEAGVANAVERAQAPEAKARLRTQTERAIEAGVFGVPTMLIDGELFWGSDSLPHLNDHLGGAEPLPADLVERWAHITPSATR
ncbi:MAG: 2-hydroxychromene-2-carboxylate isomerase [Myxococcota bacterium]|jgi:2-hydroxychromene-2-carboxylate isomerase